MTEQFLAQAYHVLAHKRTHSTESSFIHALPIRALSYSPAPGPTIHQPCHALALHRTFESDLDGRRDSRIVIDRISHILANQRLHRLIPLRLDQ